MRKNSSFSRRNRSRLAHRLSLWHGRLYHSPPEFRGALSRVGPLLLYTGAVDGSTGGPASQTVDLLLAYDWPYDEPFVSLLSGTFRRAGRSLAAVSPQALSVTLADLRAERLKPRAYLDRALRHHARLPASG